MSLYNLNKEKTQIIFLPWSLIIDKFTVILKITIIQYIGYNNGFCWTQMCNILRLLDGDYTSSC